MVILTLTQHVATGEQVSAGVEEPPAGVKELISRLLTFEDIPSTEEMKFRARTLAEIARASRVEAALIGGAPYFMSALEQALLNVGVEPIYSFSQRVSVEETQTDGSVRKVSAFKHVGFVRPYQGHSRWTVIPMGPDQLFDYFVGNGMDCFAAGAVLRPCQ